VQYAERTSRVGLNQPRKRYLSSVISVGNIARGWLHHFTRIRFMLGTYSGHRGFAQAHATNTEPRITRYAGCLRFRRYVSKTLNEAHKLIRYYARAPDGATCASPDRGKSNAQASIS